MHHCLSKEELKQLINARIGGEEIDDELLRIWVSNAECWMDELGGLNYFLSHILERAKKADESCEGIMDVFFELENHMALVLQEFDFRFIDFMLKRLRDKSISLEDELIGLQEDVGEYRYDRTLRFGHHLINLSL